MISQAVMVEEFEKSARRKGYSCDKDEFGRYLNSYVAEAWAIFSTIDINALKEN